MKKQIELLIIGAGSRGSAYARFAKDNPERVKIVGVAEPDEVRRTMIRDAHSIPDENVFTDWREAAERPKFADGVIISTQDAMHKEPALAFARKGYHMLLEKPIAPNEEDCRIIVDAVKKAGIIFSVCHVLQYTGYTKKLKSILDSGRIGEIVGIQRLEPVGYWHQAHSFVRGNWRNTEESSFMLLAKSCHDIDWIRYIMGKRCLKVSSFGSLKHFRKEEKPAEAGDRCTSCGYEPKCPYSALKLYMGRYKRGFTGWPVSVITPNVNEDGIREALKRGPYGRCVYECDNDVVDNQVVNMYFEGGETSSFTMTAFTPTGHRKTRIFGTRGQIEGDGEKIRIFDFMTDEWETVELSSSDGSISGGHGGGDTGLMDAFVGALQNNDPGKITTGPDETLESHIMVFRAEKARLTDTVVEIN